MHAREQRAADLLRVGLHETEPIAVSVSRELREALLRKHFRELDVAREQRVRRAHQRIERIVADAGQRAMPYQLAGAFLPRRISTHGRELRMRRRHVIAFEKRLDRHFPVGRHHD